MDNVENDVISKLTLMDATCLKSIAEILEVEVPEEKHSNANASLSEFRGGWTAGGASLFLKMNDFSNRSINSLQKQQFSTSSTELLFKTKS